jgi:parallel beta-helix repeat protein
MSRNPHLISVLMVVLLLSAVPSYCRTWHVRQDGTGDTPFIQSAIDAAQPGDTVLVGPGHYLQPMIEMGDVHLISEAGPGSTIIELLRVDLERDVHVIVIGWATNCSVIGFTIRGAMGGMLDSGGGIMCLESSALIKNNIITDNWCSTGGGIACLGTPSPTVENNLMNGNGAFAGAAIVISDSSPIIRNNTVVDNHAGDSSGGLHIFGDSYPLIENNIIVGNTAETYGAIHTYTPAEQITFRCNDVWGNSPRNYDGTLTDQTGVNGNISEDPLFCGAAGSRNYYLQVSSPCAPGNVPASCGGVGMGRYPVKCAVGVEKESWGRVKSLFKERGK